MYNYFQILWKFNWVHDDINDPNYENRYIDGIKIKIDSNLHEHPDFFFLINKKQIKKFNKYKSDDCSDVIDLLDNMRYSLENHEGKVTWNLLNKIKQQAIDKLLEMGFTNDYGNSIDMF